MHFRLITIFDNHKAENSREARNFVDDYLMNQGFVSDGKVWNGICDWFIIGGRWSGDLEKAHLEKNKLEELEDEFENKYGWTLGGKDSIDREDRMEQMQSLFDKYFPDFDGVMPYWRDTYKDNGYSDDAQIIDQDIWDRVISDYNNPEDTYQYQVTDDYDQPLVYCIDDSIKENMIGDYWAVIVDYHI